MVLTILIQLIIAIFTYRNKRIGMCGATFNTLCESFMMIATGYLAVLLLRFNSLISKAPAVHVPLTQDSDTMYGFFLIGILRVFYWSVFTNNIHVQVLKERGEL